MVVGFSFYILLCPMSTPGTGAAPAASRPRLAPTCGSLARLGVSGRAAGPGALPSLPRRAREPKRGAVLAEGSAPTARAAPSGRAPSAPAGAGFCGFYLFLRKGVKWRNLGLPAAERCSEAQPLRGCGAGAPGAGGPRQHPSCGRAACAGGGGWGSRWLFGGQWWPLPVAWG